VITGVHSESRIERLIEEAIMEDLGIGDITTDAIVPADEHGRGEIRAKEPGVIAGVGIASQVFLLVDPHLKCTPFVADGSAVTGESVVASVEGPVAGILKAERTALNILQRMSGIATLTRKFVEAVKGTGARITDTRKTAPGLRVLDKLAVRLGGGTNHRFGLDDMVLIKSNHIDSAGGIGRAVERSLRFLKEKEYRVRVEVETRTLDEVREAMRSPGIDRIMLDNYSISDMARAVKLIDHTVEVEASGNVSLETVRAIAETGVDYISVGALTHSPKALDLSLKILPPGTSSRTVL
jgi:nicotinate-nucleotide pyrophosphorylase (carboxylating)